MPADLTKQKIGEFKDETGKLFSSSKFIEVQLKEGKVTAVCQNRGCWMEIGDETKRAHIKMAGHSFFVPKTAFGHHAIVQGQLTVPTL